MNPRPNSAFFDLFYKEYFWPVYIGDHFSDMEDLYISDLQESKSSQILNSIASYLPSGIANFADIGSGLGGMLSVIQKMKPQYNAVGIDPSRQGCEFASIKGHEVHCCQFSEISDQFYEFFDVITSIHVLEHVEQPKELLNKIHSLLKLGGLAYIEVPDLASSKWKGHGKNYFHIAHLHYFSDFNLAKLLKMQGFDVIKLLPGATKEWPWAIGMLCRKIAIESIPYKMNFSENVNRLTTNWKIVSRLKKEKVWSKESLVRNVGDY